MSPLRPFEVSVRECIDTIKEQENDLRSDENFYDIFQKSWNPIWGMCGRKPDQKKRLKIEN